jgi:hypothetical protein
MMEGNTTHLCSLIFWRNAHYYSCLDIVITCRHTNPTPRKAYFVYPFLSLFIVSAQLNCLNTPFAYIDIDKHPHPHPHPRSHPPPPTPHR